MWNFKYFKTQKQMEKWFEKNKHKYQINEIIVNNGYGLEYKPLIIINFD